MDFTSPEEPVVLAGLSFGGLASLHFALHFPDRVRALVLISTGPGFKKPEAQRAWSEQVERIAKRLEKTGFNVLELLIVFNIFVAWVLLSLL